MNKYEKAIFYIKKAYDANIMAHEWYSYKYEEKKEFLIKACSFIKKNKLNIKYGRLRDYKYNSSIIYFCWKGRQVSFHDFSKELRKIKKYNWKWSAVENTVFPLKY